METISLTYFGEIREFKGKLYINIAKDYGVYWVRYKVKYGVYWVRYKVK